MYLRVNCMRLPTQAIHFDQIGQLIVQAVMSDLRSALD